MRAQPEGSIFFRYPPMDGGPELLRDGILSAIWTVHPPPPHTEIIGCY
jgi:hypothetical protein